jgi:hypothetical protein
MVVFMITEEEILGIKKHVVQMFNIMLAGWIDLRSESQPF